MKSKKTIKANLEKRKPTMLLIGLALSTAMVLESFEWLEADSVGTSIASNLAEEIAPENIIEFNEIKPKEKIIIPQKKTKTTVVTVVKTTIPAAGPVVVDPLANDIPDVDWDAFVDDDEGAVTIEIDSVFVIVEDAPEFPGGIKAMYEFLGDNIKYPQASVDVGSEGKAYVNFTIEKNGKITDVKILGGNADINCQNEAKRVVNKMPKWKPGKQRGKRVRVSYTLPVNFVLD